MLVLRKFRKDDSYNIVATCFLDHESLQAEAGLGFEIFRKDHGHYLFALSVFISFFMTCRAGASKVKLKDVHDMMAFLNVHWIASFT